MIGAGLRIAGGARGMERLVVHLRLPFGRALDRAIGMPSP